MRKALGGGGSKVETQKEREQGVIQDKACNSIEYRHSGDLKKKRTQSMLSDIKIRRRKKKT